MKALKNDSTAYIQQIVTTISNCYENCTEQTNAELMALYTAVGQCICQQGEKAFVVHLAQALTAQLPQIKGFSPRNLRRMRDFYRTYEKQPELMQKAQTLGWTQNAVILDCCETDEQRSFYIALAAESNLSKLALIRAVEAGAFGAMLTAKTSNDAVATACPAVGDDATESATDTIDTAEIACAAFVPACEPSRQGNGLPTDKATGLPADCDETLHTATEGYCRKQKRSSRPTLGKAVELLPRGCIDLRGIRQWLHLRSSHPIEKLPPRWWNDFGILAQRTAFA